MKLDKRKAIVLIAICNTVVFELLTESYSYCFLSNIADSFEDNTECMPISDIHLSFPALMKENKVS